MGLIDATVFREEIAPKKEKGQIKDRQFFVVTGRFTTSRVNVIVRLTIAGPDGSTEVLEGTTVHPIWSVDRNDWIQLSDLQEGERLLAADGIATVVSISIVSTNVPVYNIEVHGEHVYQVGELGLLVHNACDGHHAIAKFLGGNKLQNLAHIPRSVHRELHSLLRSELRSAGIPLSVGGKGGSAADWARYMAANPGSQAVAFDAILNASRAIDTKWGTNTVQSFWRNLQSFWRNLMSGNFTPYP